MAGLLRNKVVVITGSSSGIGRATAIACAQQGANLVLHHLGDTKAEEDIETLQKELASIDSSLNHVTQDGDLTQRGVTDAVINKCTSTFGRIDVLVNNAGICKFEDFQNVTPELFEQHTAVNVYGPFYLAQAASKQMKAQGHGGSIVNISSITAHRGASQLAHYAATKAAVLGMTFSIASALGPAGIRVNSICPGTIETSMNKKDLDRDGKRAEVAARVPLKRLGHPSDVAGVVIFFASDLAKYVTGQSLLVDGGDSILLD